MCGWPKIRWYNTINARLNWNEMLKHIEGKWKEMTKLIMCWYFVKHFVCQRYIVTLYQSICVELRVIFERHEDICEKKQGTSWSRCNTLQWKLQRFQIWWSRNFIAWKYIVCCVAKNKQKSRNIKNEMQDRFWKNCWYCLVTLKCQMLVLLLKETARSMFFRKDFYHS